MNIEPTRTNTADAAEAVEKRPASWHLGKKHSQEWIEAQRAGIVRAWKDPSKMQAMRHQSAELIEKRAAALRGVKKPDWFGAKISKALTGRRLSEEHRAKAVKHLRRYESLTPEQRSRRNESISKQRTGTHNYGRAARDRLDHFNAIHWVVRDANGVTHEFDNLQSWARANERRFLPDKRPGSKLSLWRRAVGGFNDMQRNDKGASKQWRGWTLVLTDENQHGTSGD